MALNPASPLDSFLDRAGAQKLGFANYEQHCTFRACSCTIPSVYKSNMVQAPEPYEPGAS